MTNKEKGFSAPLVLILALFLLGLPVYLWSAQKASNPQENIRGASTVGIQTAKNGVRVVITADSATWDLSEYLCESKEECLESLDSGRRVTTISGGETDLHEIVIGYQEDWSDYEYLKLFVRSGWYSQTTSFSASVPQATTLIDIQTIEDSYMAYDVVLIPTSLIQDSFVEGITFSDR